MRNAWLFPAFLHLLILRSMFWLYVQQQYVSLVHAATSHPQSTNDTTTLCCRYLSNEQHATVSRDAEHRRDAKVALSEHQLGE